MTQKIQEETVAEATTSGDVLDIQDLPLFSWCLTENLHSMVRLFRKTIREMLLIVFKFGDFRVFV